MSAAAEVEALQSALAGVHAALWGYGIAASRLRGSTDEAAADGAHADYRDLRDRLVTMVRRRDASPVAAEPSYELPFEIIDESSARRLAVHLEDRCAPLLGQVVATARDAELAGFAATQLAAIARRCVRFGAEPRTFPGLLPRSG